MGGLKKARRWWSFLRRWRAKGGAKNFGYFGEDEFVGFQVERERERESLVTWEWVREQGRSACEEAKRERESERETWCTLRKVEIRGRPITRVQKNMKSSGQSCLDTAWYIAISRSHQLFN